MTAKISFSFVCFLVVLFASFSTQAMVQKNEPNWKKLSPLLQDSAQLVWVEPSANLESKIKLYEKKMPSNQWQLVTLNQMPSEFPVVLGLMGFAKPGKKVEGDKKTPVGLYAFGEKFFGKGDEIFTHWQYKRVTTADKWIDDQAHPDYNKWIVGETTAKSYEPLLRNDEVYDLAAVIDYNTHPIVPGAGSAIFMHIWRGSLIGTAGCVAMPRAHLSNVLHWLDQRKNPKILLSDVN